MKILNEVLAVGIARTQVVRPYWNLAKTARNIKHINRLTDSRNTPANRTHQLHVRDYFTREAVFRVQGKGGRDRLAFIVDEQTLRIQRAHMEARARVETDSPALFLNASGGRLSTQGMTNVIARLRRETRIRRHVTPHMLRHTVATLLLRNGVDIRVVQEFLGHASIATTQRCTHVSKEHMVRVLRKRHPSLNLRTRSYKGHNLMDVLDGMATAKSPSDRL